MNTLYGVCMGFVIGVFYVLLVQEFKKPGRRAKK